MRAHILESYGPDGIVATTLDEPRISTPAQVEIAVTHAAVNPIDLKIRDGHLREMLPLPLPVVIGSDVAGTVTAVGDAVTDLRVGDRVAGYADTGAFAEHVVTRRARVTAIPEGLASDVAAALVTAAETSQRLLRLLAPLPAAGSTVVVNGASGSVGSLVTQLLARDHRVVGTASPRNHDEVRRLGRV